LADLAQNDRNGSSIDFKIRNQTPLNSAGNEKDNIWNRLAAAKQENLVTIDFAPLPGSTANELVAKWDVVMGVTPEHG